MAMVLQTIAVLLIAAGGLAVMLRQPWAGRLLILGVGLAVLAGFASSRPDLAGAALGIALLLLLLATVVLAGVLGLIQKLVRAMFGEAAAGHVAGVYVVRFLDALFGRRRR